MADNLRLRLVVRRHALPEVRVVFSVRIENDPTIANLLEQINELIPLESNDWGLEDYTVELRDAQGRGFDCMHFQQVSTVLKNDEEIFIRPLVTEDRKKRRLSGRHQISSDGKHLIDGIAFGRPRLKTPRDRPPIDIPPLKRRRITYDSEDADIEPDSDGESSPLLLTEHGEQHQDPKSVRISADFDGLDVFGSDGDDDEEDDEFVGDDADEAYEDLDDINQSEIDDELRDLQMANAQLGDEYQDDEQQLEPAVENTEQDAGLVGEAGPAGPVDGTGLDLVDLDKIAALRAAFPTAPVDECEKTLLRCGKDERKAYTKLVWTYPASLSRQGMLEHFERIHACPSTKPDDDESMDGSDAESVDSLTKHYDQHGFPSGSILAGTASTHTADKLRQSGQRVKLPVHTKFDQDDEMDTEVGARGGDSPRHGPPDTSSDAASHVRDASSESGFEGIESSAENEFGPGSDDDGSSESQSSSEDDTDSDSDSDSDSGPEVASSRQIPEPRGGAKVDSLNDPSLDADDNQDSGDSDDDDSDESSDDSSNSSSDDDSDSENESEVDRSEDRDDGAAPGSASGPSDTSSSDSESDSSSDSDSDSDPGSKPNGGRSSSATSVTKTKPSTVTTTAAQPEKASSENTPAVPGSSFAVANADAPVPPGQGKTATQRRNARRRTALKTKKTISKGEISLEPSVYAESDNSLAPNAIAAKKAALLARLGLAEKSASVEPADQAAETCKVTEAQPSSPSPPAPADESGSAASQRKTKLDLGAGRRMLFGALGLKNPKTKADEDKIRSDLMKDVRALVNPRLESQGDNAQADASHQHETEEDPEAWRERITYRAVECCQEGIKLSEPPFPFVQRWDPQQHGGWRGGRSKRKQRNHADFNEGDQPSAKKRRYAEHEGEDIIYHDDYSYYNTGNWDEDANITLNYDDNMEVEEPPRSDGIEPGQDDSNGDGDNDDIPPVPSDVSTLPLVQSGELSPGMVLVWKQLLLSKATNWQPQVSRLAGTVVEVYDGDDVRVRLGKSYRNLDQNEKTYDDDGNRVYDKFELPDMDDEIEDEAELGYRTLAVADMIEPRVLYRPAQVISTTPTDAEQQAAGPDHHITREPVGREDSKAKTEQSAILDHEHSQNPLGKSNQAKADTQHTDSIIPETVHESLDEPPAAQLLSANDVSISEDRRHEISQLMSEAGFGKDVSPSITEDKADLSSPSRQLQEMSQEAAALPVLPPQRQNSPQGISPALDRAPAQAANSNYGDSQPVLLEPFNGFSEEPPSSIPRQNVEYPRLRVDAPYSDSGSIRSGRQPDPDLSMDLGDDNVSDRLEAEPRDTGAGIASPTFPRSHAPDKPAVEPPKSYESSPATSKSSSIGFPDLPDIGSFLSASTNSSATPSKAAVLSAIKARKSEVAPDLQYEEAMRRLDEDDASDEELSSVKQEANSQNQRPFSFAKKLVTKPIEKPAVKKATKSSAVKIEKGAQAPPPRSRILRSRNSSHLSGSFKIPEGSQVVSLLSSSPEPEVAEVYADDSVDETYEDPDMSSGLGWVPKRWGSRRGVSLPAASAPLNEGPRAFTASQGRQSLSSGSAARSKKKTMARAY